MFLVGGEERGQVRIERLEHEGVKRGEEERGGGEKGGEKRNGDRIHG